MAGEKLNCRSLPRQLAYERSMGDFNQAKCNIFRVGECHPMMTRALMAEILIPETSY